MLFYIELKSSDKKKISKGENDEYIVYMYKIDHPTKQDLIAAVNEHEGTEYTIEDYVAHNAKSYTSVYPLN